MRKLPDVPPFLFVAGIIVALILALIHVSRAQAPLPPTNKLSLMRDTKITSPADKQVLTYVLADSKWENLNPSAGALSSLTDVALGPLLTGNLLQWSGTQWTNHSPLFTDLGGNIAISQMNSGSGASSATYWRGDNTWASPATGGIAATTNLLVGDGAGNALSAATVGNLNVTATQLNFGVGGNFLNYIVSTNPDSTAGHTNVLAGFQATTLNSVELSSIGPFFVTSGIFQAGDSRLFSNTSSIDVAANPSVKFSNDGGSTERLRIGNGLMVGTTTDPGAGIVNVNTGFRIGNTAPLNHTLVGNGTTYVDSATGVGATVVFTNPGGRLTTESGVPVSTTDRTAQGTLYYTPAIHNNIVTYNGSLWVANTFSEISLSLTLTSGKNYDVFVNSAANALSLSAAWTNDTTRANALGTQDGVTVLASDHTKLWVGTIRASGTNVTEDSAGGSTTNVGGKRFVWNAYNQVTRTMAVKDTTSTWSYTTATIRQARATAGNKVEYVTGYAGDVIDATLWAAVELNNNTVVAYAGIGLDSTTSFIGAINSCFNNSATAITFFQAGGKYQGSPGLGYHYVSWNEQGADSLCSFVGAATSGANSALLVIFNN